MTSDELWAEVGRRIGGLEHDLINRGFEVIIRWDRPHDRVDVTIRPGETPEQTADRLADAGLDPDYE
jgi:hypothetical protein